MKIKALSRKQHIVITICLAVILIPSFFIYSQNIKQPLQKDATANLLKSKGDQFKLSGKIELAMGAYSEAYSLSPTDRDIIDEYVAILIVTGQSEKAYSIIKKYFDETPKDIYWEDINLWQERAITSMDTHRCLEAGTAAYHILMRTKEGSDETKLADSILRYSLNDKDCVDTETFYHDGDVVEADSQSKSCTEAIKSQIQAYKADNLSDTETFDKYKVKVYDGPLAMLNTKLSSGIVNKFKTRIDGELANTGINFAGKYSLVSVGMTGWGLNHFLVDRTNGKGVIVPFRINFSDEKKDSTLLMINHNTILWDDSGGFGAEYSCASTGFLNEYYPDLRPHYYNWDGRTFRNIGNPSPVNEFWESLKLN